MKKIIASALVALAIVIGLAAATPRAQAFQPENYGTTDGAFTGLWWPKTPPPYAYQHTVGWCYNVDGYDPGTGAAGYNAFIEGAIKQAADAWTNALSPYFGFAYTGICHAGAGTGVGGDFYCCTAEGDPNVHPVTVWNDAGFTWAGTTRNWCVVPGGLASCPDLQVGANVSGQVGSFNAYVNWARLNSNYTVLSVMLHEFGHVLGLQNCSVEPTSCKVPPDDATEGLYDVCAAHPGQAIAVMCNVEPAGGFQTPQLDDVNGGLYIYQRHDGAGCIGRGRGPHSPWFSGRQVAWADVNADGGVGANDGQLIFTWFTHHDGTGNTIQALGGGGPNYYDIDGNGHINSVDSQLAYTKWKNGLGGTCSNGP